MPTLGCARAAAAVAVVAAAATGCGSSQSTLKPRSDASRDIATLWWIMLAGAGVVFAVVVMLVLLAVVRRHGARRDDTDDRRAKRLIFAGGVAAPVLLLSALFGVTVRTLPATSAPRQRDARIRVDVMGKQWFWIVRYPGTRAVTANEIHIPAGEPVELAVTTRDVIHSFWLPALNRKIDLIPGKTNRVLLQADRPGTYRGQCAEFCGLQHANMAFLVVAEPSSRFRTWLASQARPRRLPAGGEAVRGERVFLGEACRACHTIRGTRAGGRVGPDLTHVGSRETLAANTIPNTRAELSRWIRDPQHVKPGNRMPGLDLTDSQVDALVAYLAGLK